MDLCSPSTTKNLLEKYNLWAKKSLGQNFLISKNVLEKIVETSEINHNEQIVEIGPGLGVLTNELAQKAKTVTSIELDKTLLPLLKETLSNHKNIKIINENALSFPAPKTPYKVVANIPYNITSPIINHFLQAKNKPDSLTLLVQYEVAEKICDTEDMTVLSLQVALFGKAKMIKKVSPGCFYPPPKVSSAILHIKLYTKKDREFINTETALKILKVAKRAFSQRRKKLSNTLPDLREQLDKLKLADLRPQTLSTTDWLTLIKTPSSLEKKPQIR